MVWMSKVEDGITENYVQLRVLPRKHPGKWIVSGLDHNSITSPLPKLPLSGPKLRSVVANHQSVALTLLDIALLNRHS
jgi:hypothetical protein